MPHVYSKHRLTSTGMAIQYFTAPYEIIEFHNYALR